MGSGSGSSGARTTTIVPPTRSSARSREGRGSRRGCAADRRRRARLHLHFRAHELVGEDDPEPLATAAREAPRPGAGRARTHMPFPGSKRSGEPSGRRISTSRASKTSEGGCEMWRTIGTAMASARRRVICARLYQSSVKPSHASLRRRYRAGCSLPHVRRRQDA